MVGERIKEIRQKLNLSQTEFSSKLGIKQHTLSYYETGRNFPSDSSLETISKMGINLDWLLAGRGSMYLGNVSPNNADILTIGVSNAGVQGAASGMESLLNFFISKHAIPTKYQAGNIESIVMIDNSMSPTVGAGDIILYSPGEVGGNGNYILDIDGERTYRELEFVPGSRVRIIPHNTKYEPVTIDRAAGAVVIVGRVIAWFHVDRS